MSQLLLEELATIAKANQYDAIKDDYRRLQESEKRLKEVLKDIVDTLNPLVDNPVHAGLMDKAQAAILKASK